MAWTDTTLRQAIQDHLENDETTFVANLDSIIVQAEERILLKAQLPAFRTQENLLMTIGQPYIPTPADWLSTYSISIDNSGFEFLVQKDVQFLREVYPSAAATGVPRYYAIENDDQIAIAPTPIAAYATELVYFYNPPSITTATTSWLGTHAMQALLMTCLYEGYRFMKGDADQLAVYEKDMNDAIGDLKILVEGRNKVDEYRGVR
jgi:hypothetical protein